MHLVLGHLLLVTKQLGPLFLQSMCGRVDANEREVLFSPRYVFVLVPVRWVIEFLVRDLQWKKGRFGQLDVCDHTHAMCTYAIEEIFPAYTVQLLINLCLLWVCRCITKLFFIVFLSAT